MQAKCCGDTSVRHTEIDGFNSLRLLHCGPDVTAANEASNLVVRVQIPRAARIGPKRVGYRLKRTPPRAFLSPVFVGRSSRVIDFNSNPPQAFACPQHGAPGRVVVDPFMGSGTTLVEGLLRGGTTIGVRLPLPDDPLPGSARSAVPESGS